MHVWCESYKIQCDPYHVEQIVKYVMLNIRLRHSLAKPGVDEWCRKPQE